VTLKIYDIIGSELITLMNSELKSSGKHEISFNAENFSSGIYFYKLVTEKFSDVKSMILLK
jgi:hypothetical protein